MKLTASMERIITFVHAGYEDTVFLFDEDLSAIKNQFKNFTNFINFIEKKTGTSVVYVNNDSMLADGHASVTVTFLNGAIITFRTYFK